MTTSWCGNVSILLALCVQNPPVTSGCPAQKAKMWSFDVYFVQQLVGANNKQLKFYQNCTGVMGACAALLQCRVILTDLDLISILVVWMIEAHWKCWQSANLIPCSYLVPNSTTRAGGQRAKSGPKCTNNLIWVMVRCLFVDNDYINQLWLGVNLPIRNKISEIIQSLIYESGPCYTLHASLTAVMYAISCFEPNRPGDKPLSEPLMVSLLTHICIIQPQWVNPWLFFFQQLIKVNNKNKSKIYITDLLCGESTADW